MTFTNLGFSSNPLTNPLKLTATRQAKTAFRADQHATLPEVKPVDYDSWRAMQDSLQPPNQLDYECGQRRLDTVAMSQQNPSLVVCPDGTVLDIEACRVVLDPKKGAKNGQWSKVKAIEHPLDAIYMDSQNNQNLASVCTDIQSQAFWEKQRKEAQSGEPIDQAKAALQKELMQQLEDGMLVCKSRLEEVDGS